MDFEVDVYRHDYKGYLFYRLISCRSAIGACSTRRQVSLTPGVVARGDNARLKLCVASLAILHREQCALFFS